MNQPEEPIAGSGPLYPHTPSALAAADEPVHIPRPDAEGEGDGTEPDSASNPHPTGEEQAEDNRGNESPV
jgi:hypothetical protein